MFWKAAHLMWGRRGRALLDAKRLDLFRALAAGSSLNIAGDAMVAAVATVELDRGRMHIQTQT